MDKETLKKIESFGDIFKKEYRSQWNKEQLQNDWIYALKFFFDHSFMRGRKDSLSIRFKDKSIEVLEKTFFKDQNFSFDSLEEELKQNEVNNKADRMMVIDTLKFIKNLDDYNITNFAIKGLKENEQESYDKLRDIKFIGDKIATLYFREICWMFDIKIKNQMLIFPIDTWVKQIINRLRILDGDKILPLIELRKVKDSKVKEKAIEVCIQNSIDPIKFNAGVWYIGTHSLEIVLNNLNVIK
jgi:hypothetical protein